MFEYFHNRLNIKQEKEIKEKNLEPRSHFTLPRYCRNKKKQYLCARG